MKTNQQTEFKSQYCEELRPAIHSTKWQEVTSKPVKKAEFMIGLNHCKIGDNYSEKELDQIREIDIIPGAVIDYRVEYYSEFLNDGDYETFMPIVFNEPGLEEKCLIEIERARANLRLLWIEKRYVKFLDFKWKALHDKFVIWQKYKRIYEALLEKATKGKYELKPPLLL